MYCKPEIIARLLQVINAKKERYYRRKRLNKLLNYVSEDVDVLFNGIQKKYFELHLRNSIERTDQVICKLRRSVQPNKWALEFTNNAASRINVIKISAENYYSALSDMNYYEQNLAYQKKLKANPGDERNIDPGGSALIVRGLPYEPITPFLDACSDIYG